jgi:hypothetical protein
MCCRIQVLAVHSVSRNGQGRWQGRTHANSRAAAALNLVFANGVGGLSGSGAANARA